ncbi:MAG: purine-nucleoside phosphorylase [Coriobacteriales bacterium]|jgi:purine-nucleoside phosphorylase|nr:purine-nucleoside phosphorylase [Coriobacteriales bacterium]
MSLNSRIAQARAVIQPRLETPPQVALICGSGLGGLAEHIDAPVTINYEEIPHFKTVGAPGHKGRLVFGTFAGQQVVAMQGRLHGYEGNTAEEVVFPLRVMHALGARTLIVTNAAGGINTDFEVGDVMLIIDHINFTGMNPLTIGAEQELYRFPDMSHAYTSELRHKALAAAETCGMALRQGVYIGVRGPSFETPAEIRAFRVWGADAVGMSTVFEAITAASLGMEVLGLSLITNMAAGIFDAPLAGGEVLEVSEAISQKLECFMAKLFADL